jgi:phospholipase C
VSGGGVADVEDLQPLIAEPAVEATAGADGRSEGEGSREEGLMEGSPAASAGNLGKIEHVVVLMLENRSFDHMLGYLSLEGGRSDIDGLRPGMTNSYGGRDYPAHRLAETMIKSEKWDPNHSAKATDHQIGDGAMDGFAASYGEALKGRQVPDPDPGLAMGYFGAEQVPVYDHLAAHFCVCDAWHSSVPGATWPNRLYAVAGSADGSRDDRPHPQPPIYNKASFIRHLSAAGIDWRWYSYDIGSLRAADAVEYGLDHLHHFRWVDRLKLGITTRAEELPFIDEDAPSFIEEARSGKLPPFSWIDPNFKDMNLVGSPSNDDHPPSDVKDGQELVFLVYNALASNPEVWEKTMLIVTYDEHGGFYDHVPPPEAPDDDPQNFGRYGVRVPAVVVSPWVDPGSVGKDLFDHTSIIKTVLRRFCPSELEHRSGAAALIHWLEEGHPHYMGKRVAEANNLGGLLTRSEPRQPPNRRALAEWAAHRHGGRARQLHKGEIAGGRETGLSDLQQSFLLFARNRHDEGHPPGQP